MAVCRLFQVRTDQPLPLSNQPTMSNKSHIHQLRNRIWLAASMFILLIVLFVWYVASEKALEDAQTLRYVSVELAREMRQSADDQTRAMRTYVVTGNPIYKKHYQEILDIRNGLTATPKNYQNVYWDLVMADDIRPRAAGNEHVPLLERMRRAGFTSEEFNLLAQAKSNSDALTSTELAAMRLIEAPTQVDPATRLKAVEMLTDDGYREAKSTIMRPLAEFTEKVETRTQGVIGSLQNQTAAIRAALMALGLLMLWTLASTYATIQKTLGATVGQLHNRIARLGSGDITTPIDVPPGMDNSILGWLSQMQINLAQLETARRDAEQKLETTKQRMVNIIHATQVGTWERNMQTGTMLVNERWASMLGYTLAELEPISNVTWQRLVHPDDLEQSDILKQLHFEGRMQVYECKLRMQHKDGHWVWILTRGSLLSRTQEGEPEWMAGSHLDISALEQASSQLRDNEQQLRVMLNEMPIGICLVDKNGKIFFRNRYLVDLLGYTDIDIPDLETMWRVAFPDMSYRAEAMRVWGTALRGAAEVGQIIAAQTYTAFALDGTKVEVEISGITTSFGFLATLTDRTESTRIQEQLEEAKTMAESASRAKSAFLANMSHEIRTPMNGMLGMIKLLSQTELNSQQLDYAKKAESATKALLGIINDILDFSKIEAGKFELDHSEFLLNDLLRDLSTVLSSSQTNRNVEVLFAVDEGIPAVLTGDPLRLRQVLLNLAGNALKFTERGEVVLSIRLKHLEHSDSPLVPDRATLEFTVLDTGIGIPADKLQHIFESFHQAESSTARRFGGTGLGLAISRQLLAMMGGDLQVSSRYGHGSRFFFTLTLEAGKQVAPVLIPVADDLTSLRLLVVDDNATSREILGGMIATLGWVADIAKNGNEALQMLEQPDAPNYDVILMDWRMPGLDGWETIRRIRALHNGQNEAVIVMITAHGLEFFNQKTREDNSLRIAGYLFKPVTAGMLFDAVRDARETGDSPPSTHRHRFSSRRLAGQRILVVEDNRLNQQIAKELLELNGAQVEVASNGQQGIDQALSWKPSVILMDMQMPDIDGLEATRRILQHPEMQSTPIIAMTANVMEVDRQACLQAGMVDHVGKPVDLEKLLRTILKHSAIAGMSDEGSPPDATQWPADLQGRLVDVEQAINRIGGNRALYNKMITALKSDSTAQLAELRRQLQERDMVAAARSLHTFKGLIATIGADSLARLAAAAEQLVRKTDVEPDLPLLLQKVADIESVLRRVITELDTHDIGAGRDLAPVVTPDADQLSAPRQALLQTELAQLMDNLKSNNMRSLTISARIRNDHSNWLDIHALDLLLDMDESINQLNFNGALALCNQLQEIIQ